MGDGDAPDGALVMAQWMQKLKPAAGALPGGIVRKFGIGFCAVVILGLGLSTIMTDGTLDEAEPLAGSEPNLTGAGQVAQLTSRLTDIQESQQRQRDREADLARREAEASAHMSALFGQGTPTVGTAGVGTVPSVPPADGERPDPEIGDAGGGSPGPATRTPEEIELRERLRLEAVERRARSLRAPAMVQTFRTQPVTGAIAPTPAAPADAPAAQAATAPPDPLALFGQITDAAAAAAQAASGGTELQPWERTVPGVTGPAVQATADPVTVTTPDDPVGWERVYEGAVFSAVLVTQLSGDFAGPVQAHVSIPFYSADRQRILVPRGARFLGTVQPVRDHDQRRLAVGFHRLVWPDGRWVDLSFHGLNALGEGALLDQVNRHYVSMFAAAGAVGVISGLTLQGANPYGGGREGFQAGVSQGLGQSASQILDRFLNRLPTITIRAGHRLRVWLTADVLVPRPAAHPERMFR